MQNQVSTWRGAASHFIETQAIYLGIIILDVLWFAALISEDDASRPTPPDVPVFANPQSLLNPDYLEWASQTCPILVKGLGLLLLGVFVAFTFGLLLLGRAIGHALKRQSCIKESPPRPAGWGLWDVLKVAATYPFFLMLAATVTSISRLTTLTSQSFAMLINLGLNACAMIGTFLAMMHVVRVEKKQALSTLGLTLDEAWRNLLRGLGCYAAMLPLFLGAAAITQLIANQFGVKPRPQEMVPMFMAERSLPVMVAFMGLACLLAPFVEETFFRGFLQSGLRRFTGGRLAIFLSALLFALAHRNFSVFLPVFVLGVMLGYLYEKTQSLVGVVFLHALHNTVTTCFLLLLKFLPVREMDYTIV